MRYFLSLMVPSVVAVMATTGVAYGLAGASWYKAIWAGVVVLTIFMVLSLVLTIVAIRLRKYDSTAEVADNSSKGGDQP
jgi:ABC-type transport system involved in cytochrome bd biosynthesis fused ATPase/permease subunit